MSAEIAAVVLALLELAIKLAGKAFVQNALDGWAVADAAAEAAEDIKFGPEKSNV